MKKFYIPTSTLNFNNILSTESISPKAFYEKRGFGYSRWATVPENPFDNSIVLHDSLCYFDRPNSDLEDHPLLIEVVLDETQLKQAEGFWYCDHTIYLAPTKTKFLFYTEKDKTITLSMSESSLETKLMRLYLRQFLTIQKPAERYKPITVCELCVLNELEMEKDIRINKMRGMLCGYYIGSILSSDLDSVIYLNVLKEIHNIFAAVLSSFEKHPTAYQNERLDVLFDYLNEQNADYIFLSEIIGSPSISVKDKTKKIWSWLHTRKGGGQNEDKSFWLNCLQHFNEKDDRENPSIVWIKAKLEEAQRKTQSKMNLLSPDKGEIVVMENQLYLLMNPNLTEEKEIRLCLSWFNDTLSDKNTNGRISTYKEELAKNLTLKAKEVYNELWEGSQTRAYLNDLRRHIAGEDFRHEWNNGLLSSIAAVLIAGDDWEKLLAFMQNKEMTDYKLAFAFYGTLNGFANLTRDFTDVLYGQNKSYVWEVYKEFYGQLHGEYKFELTESVVREDARYNVQEVRDENQVENHLIATMIEGHPKYNRKKHGKFLDQIIEQKITNWDKIRKLSKGKEWLLIIDDLSASSPKTDPELFDESEMHPIGQLFYCDKNVWYHIEPLITDVKTKKDLKKELEWIQNVHKKGYYPRRDGSRVDCTETDNRSVIDHFYKNAKNRIQINVLNEVYKALKQLYNVENLNGRED